MVIVGKLLEYFVGRFFVSHTLALVLDELYFDRSVKTGLQVTS